MRNWWNRIRCWLGSHEKGKPILRAVRDPNRGRTLVIEQRACEHCGKRLDVKVVGYVRAGRGK